MSLINDIAPITPAAPASAPTRATIHTLYTNALTLLEQGMKNVQIMIGRIIARDHDESEAFIEIVEGYNDHVVKFFVRLDQNDSHQDSTSRRCLSMETALFLVERNWLKVLKDSSSTSSDEPQSYLNMHQFQFQLVINHKFNFDLYTVYSHLLRSGYFARRRAFDAKRYNEQPFSFIVYDAWYFHMNPEEESPQISILMTRYSSKFPSMKIIHDLCEHEKHPIYFCMVEAGMLNFMRLAMLTPTVTDQILPLGGELTELPQEYKKLKR